MNNLQSLLQERELLENKIREARREQISEAIATCRRLIAEHELTEGDLFGGKGAASRTIDAQHQRLDGAVENRVFLQASPVADQ